MLHHTVFYSFQIIYRFVCSCILILSSKKTFFNKKGRHFSLRHQPTTECTKFQRLLMKIDYSRMLTLNCHCHQGYTFIDKRFNQRSQSPSTTSNDLEFRKTHFQQITYPPNINFNISTTCQ